MIASTKLINRHRHINSSPSITSFYSKILKVKMEIKYRLSFVTGKAYINESSLILQNFFQNYDWKKTEESCLTSNILQFSSLNSTKRVLREISLRLKSLSDHEQEFFLKSNYVDQSILIWIAICRTYQFIGDFASMIILEKFNKYELKIMYSDFDFFYEEQLIFHEELIALKDSTRKKLKQILFRILKELNIISKNLEITPLMPSKELREISIKTKRDLENYLPGAFI
tara:strand:+ start:274 stop:957 length:684 start_codon:yes stop_codon:yes gene_type:complete